MHEVTTAYSASSDETMLIGTLQLQAAIEARGGQTHRPAVECSGYSG
jgi:hypothetical protein